MWKTVISIISGLTLIIGTAFAVDKHYAKKDEHQQLAVAFEQYVTENKLDKTQERIWDTQDRLEKVKNPEAREELKKRLRELEGQKEKLEKQITPIQKEK